MKSKSLVILVVIFAVLAGLVALKEATKPQQTILDQVKLTPLVPKDVTRKDVAVLELYSGAKPDDKVVLTQSTNDPNVWRVTSHFKAPADKDKIEKFIDKVLDLQGELRATVPDDQGLDPYQLDDKNAFHVKGLKQGGKDVLFDVLVGKAPAYNEVFMRAEGAKDIYTLDTNLRREAGVYSEDLATAPTPDSWLDKKVLDIPKDKINKITVETPDKRFVVAKEKKEVPADASAKKEEPEKDKAKTEGADKKPEAKVEEKWVLAEGGTGNPVRQAGIENLAAAFAPLTASDIVDPDKLADWGLQTPKFKCTLAVDGHDGDVVLEGGRPDPNADGYVRVATADKSVVFKLPKYTFEKIFIKGRDLLELPSLKVDRASISQIDLTQPAGNLALAKSGEAWTVTTPAADLKPQTTSLDAIATALASWQPADYADSAEGKGLDNPSRSVKFTTATGESHTITLGGESADVAGRYARLDGTGPVLVMSKSDEDRIFLAPKDAYVHKVLDIDQDAITKVNVSRAKDSFTLAKDNGAWTLTVDGASSPANEQAAQNLASALASFQIADIAFGQPDLTTPVDTTVQVTMKDGTEHVFRIGPEDNGNHAVAISGKAETFRAPALDIKEITPASASLKQAEAKPAGMSEAPQTPVAPGAAATAEVKAVPPAAPVSLTPAPAQTPVAPAPVPVPAPVAPAAPVAPSAPAPEMQVPAAPTTEQATPETKTETPAAAAPETKTETPTAATPETKTETPATTAPEAKTEAPATAAPEAKTEAPAAAPADSNQKPAQETTQP